MRQLLPTYEAEVDLLEAYRYSADRTWVRANMVSSLDGTAVQDGRSGGLSGPADKLVFSALRGLADVVLVGAGTARTEGYRAPRTKPEHAGRRVELGQRPSPVLALVSRGLDIDPGSDLFTGDERTIVVTHAASDESARGRLGEVADVITAGTDDVDLGSALRRLAERGLTRVLCEGGPTLLGNVLAQGLLDELCLSLSPKAVGGDGTRIVSGPDVDARFDPAHVLEQDGTLFLRSVRAP